MKVELTGVAPWRHDLTTCLHGCMASLLSFYGAAPLEVLGASWGFYYRPTDVRREEYYFPCGPGDSLLEALAPYHPVRSRWHEPADAAQGWQQVREQVGSGHPVAVAVDNFFLPFRPAYRDVHSNHLLIVRGFDDEMGTVRVLDAIPPRFDGVITIAELTAARDSGNQIEHDRDMFFTDRPIGNRWLGIELTSADFPSFDRHTIAETIQRNIRAFHTNDSTVDYRGIAGQRRFIDDAANRLTVGDEVRDELFVVAGTALASTAIHADWLAAAGRRLGVARLLEIGRDVERIAHHWSAIRIMAGLTRSGEVTAERLARRNRHLIVDQDRVLADLEHCSNEL